MEVVQIVPVDGPYLMGQDDFRQQLPELAEMAGFRQLISFDRLQVEQTGTDDGVAVRSQWVPLARQNDDAAPSRRHRCRQVGDVRLHAASRWRESPVDQQDPARGDAASGCGHGPVRTMSAGRDLSSAQIQPNNIDTE